MLKIELESQGQWLFRWRSYLPLLFLPVAVIAIATMHWPFGSYKFHEVWEMACLVISCAGLGIRVATIGHAPINTSGRNTGDQVAWSLTTTGMYSVVRHPLYLGNYLIGLGAVMVPFEWWLPMLYTTVYWLYYERIMMAEEAFLLQTFGAEFERWSADTPAFVPNMSQWRPAAEPFSLRNVLRREYTGLMVVILLHGGIEFSEHLVIENHVSFELFWEALIGGGCCAYLMLRSLKKHTRLLDVPGR